MVNKCCKCPAPNMMLLDAQMQKCSCSCHTTPTVEVGWEEEFDNLPNTGMTTKEFIRSTLAHQKETLIAEMVGKLEGMKKLIYSSMTPGIGKRIAYNEAIDDIIKNIKGVE